MSQDFKRKLEAFDDAHFAKGAAEVSSNKVNAYTAGIQKKSKREREKEAAEAKRLQEEEDAAKAYKDFVASFEDPDGQGTGTGGSRGLKTFVRAGGGSASPFTPSPGAQIPPSTSKGLAATGSRGFSNERLPSNSGPAGRQSSYQPPASSSVFGGDDLVEPAPVFVGRKKRAMDSFLEELKKDQADRENRLQLRVQQGVATSVSAAAAEEITKGNPNKDGGSYDTGDLSTTNLHVGNLPANVTANAIGMHFAQFGPVASVKIMWPREEGGVTVSMQQNAANIAARRAGLNGFISFMKRKDAERALDKCDNMEWGGSILRLGWGKAMPLPPRPAYVSDTPYIKPRRSRSRSPSPKRFRQRSRSYSPRESRSRRRSDSIERGRGSYNRLRRSRSRSYSSRSRSRSPARRRPRSISRERHRPSHQRRRSYSGSSERSRSRSRSRDRGQRRRRYSSSRSRSPPRERRWPALESEEQQRLLEDIARRIRQYGKKYENTLRDREFNNPKYDFLRDESLPAFHYFRMLLDPMHIPPAPPPPPYEEEGDLEVLSSDDSALDSEGESRRKNNLGKLSRRKLEAMLRTLINTRDKIARIMVFALDRPNAAEEVVDVVIQSLLIASTPVPRKVARLNALSDILHNCAGNPTNAWKYRSLFEARLPEVFTHFGEIYKSFPGRMKAEIFRKQIMTIVQVWENWLVYTPTVLADLQNRLSTGDQSQQRSDREGSSDAGQADLGKEESRYSAPKPGFSVVKAASTNTAVPPYTTTTSTGAAGEDIDGEEIIAGAGAGDDLDGEPLDGEDIDGEDIDGAPM